MKRISLGKFLEATKADILEYEKEHRGEPGLLKIVEVEIEASIVTTIDANGKVNVFAVEFGADVEQAVTHSVRIKMSPLNRQEAFVGPFKTVVENTPPGKDEGPFGKTFVD